jgi:hypothetical protein
MLSRRRATEAQIDAAIEKLKTAPDGVHINVADGIDVIKLNLGSAFPAVNSQEVEQILLLLHSSG